MRIRPAAALCAVLLIAVPFTMRSAAASPATAGTVTIEGRAILPEAGCPHGCYGTFEGVATAALGGVNGTVPWAVEAALIPVSFLFPYWPDCVAGFAPATVDVVAVPTEAIGTYGGASTAGTIYDVVGFRLSISLDWLQAGTGVVVTTNESLQLQVDQVDLLSGTTQRVSVPVMASGLGAGAGSYVGERVPDCLERNPSAVPFVLTMAIASAS